MSGIPFFRRKASLNLYKNPKMILSKMTFTSDFTDSERGNLYPLKAKSGDVTETVDGAGYSVSGDGYAVRLLGGFSRTQTMRRISFAVRADLYFPAEIISSRRYFPVKIILSK